MFLPLHNKVTADDNTLHVQCGVTISTDGDFWGDFIRDTGCAFL